MGSGIRGISGAGTCQMGSGKPEFSGAGDFYFWRE